MIVAFYLAGDILLAYTGSPQSVQGIFSALTIHSLRLGILLHLFYCRYSDAGHPVSTSSYARGSDPSDSGPSNSDSANPVVSGTTPGYAPRTQTGTLLLLGIGTGALLFGANLLLSRIFPAHTSLPYPANPGRIATLLILILAAVSVLAEEYMFRGLLPRAFFRTGLALWPAHLISAILFSLGHVWGGLWGGIFALIAGILLGAVRIFSSSLLPGIIAHLCYNIGVLVLSGYFSLDNLR